jgi:DNA invertase Pin-like site-specific DNA recombinase
MTKHMIGYVRVSTEEQERSGLGVEAQTEAILTECDRRGWTVEIVSDLGRSGKQVNPQLRDALELLATRQSDGLIVAKLDRLARSVRHASAIIDDAIRQEWALVVLDNALDLTTPGGRAMANMLATFAELERDLISSRTKEALAARRARGDDTGRRAAIPAGVLRRIVLSREAGASFGRIARELSTEAVLSPAGLREWHESTVRRAFAAATRTTKEMSAAPAA